MLHRDDDPSSAILEIVVGNGLLLRSFLTKGGRVSLILHVVVGVITLVLGGAEISRGRMWGLGYFAFVILITLSFVYDRYHVSDA